MRSLGIFKQNIFYLQPYVSLSMFSKNLKTTDFDIANKLINEHKKQQHEKQQHEKKQHELHELEQDTKYKQDKQDKQYKQDLIEKISRN